MDTEEEAEALVTLACPRSDTGEYVAPELVQEQTLENLQLFSDRMARAHEMLENAGRCSCGDSGVHPIVTLPSALCRYCGESEDICMCE